MTTYQVFWAFPTQEASVKCTEAFVKYLTEGKQADKFEGFEIKCRIMDPHMEQVILKLKLIGFKNLEAYPTRD